MQARPPLPFDLKNHRLTLCWFQPDICPFCWLGEVATIRISCPQQRRGIKPLQALPSRHIAAHLGMPGSIPQRERTSQKPDHSRRASNSPFWVSATIRTIIVGGVRTARTRGLSPKAATLRVRERSGFGAVAAAGGTSGVMRRLQTLLGGKAERFGVGPAVVLGQRLAECAWPVGHGAPADLAAGDRKPGDGDRETT